MMKPLGFFCWMVEGEGGGGGGEGAKQKENSVSSVVVKAAKSVRTLTRLKLAPLNSPSIYGEATVCWLYNLCGCLLHTASDYICQVKIVPLADQKQETNFL